MLKDPAQLHYCLHHLFYRPPLTRLEQILAFRILIDQKRSAPGPEHSQIEDARQMRVDVKLLTETEAIASLRGKGCL
jgi:hypothetical protein